VRLRARHHRRRARRLRRARLRETRDVQLADTTLNPRGRVLAYGSLQVMGRFTCASRRAGMTCRNRGDGHGFTLARSSYRTF
jgi:uncharacterized protein DUF6636